MADTKFIDDWYKYCYPNLISENKWRKLIPKDLRPDSNKAIKNIYYVNGIWNAFGKARKFAELLEKQLNSGADEQKEKARVRLIYNKSDGLGIDLIEAMIDKTWIYGKPVLNPATIAVISVLYNAWASGKPVCFVGHSQGTLITYNAITSFFKIEKKSADFLKKNVKVLLCAPMIHSSSISRLKKITDCETYTNKKDLLPDIVGNGATTAVVAFIDKTLNLYFNPDIVLLMKGKIFSKTLETVLKLIGKFDDFKRWRKGLFDSEKAGKLAYHDFAKGYVSNIARNASDLPKFIIKN